MSIRLRGVVQRRARLSYYDIGGQSRIHYRVIANNKRERRVERENVLHVYGTRSKVCQRAIHTCRSDCHCD